MIQKTAIVVFTFATALSACQQSEKKEHEILSKEAIEVHDEIMPQIKNFDRTSVRIDSILSNLEGIKANHSDLDTANVRSELKALQGRIESATDFMMEWMRDYQPDSADVTYQKEELAKVKNMKSQFESVQADIDSRLQPLSK